MTARPDHFVRGEPAFDPDLFADRRDDHRARTWLAAALTLAVVAVCAALWWFDRVAAPPSFRPTIHPSWVPAPQHSERAFAMREVGEVKP